MSGFGEVLRAHRERCARTQLDAAKAIGVSRATFTQWEINKHLPSLQRGHELDRLLQAGGAIIAALEDARARAPRARPAPAAIPSPSGTTVAEVLRNARRALLEQLQFDNGAPTGWRHNLVSSQEPVSTLSTIYGLGALYRLGGPDASTPALADLVMKAGKDDAGRLVGWMARVQRESRPEATAQAMEALLRSGVHLPPSDVEACLERLLDVTARQRPFILTVMLEPVLRVSPQSALAAQLVELLLDCRQDFGGTELWPEKVLTRDQPMLGPSVAHTARAITALRGAPAELVGDSLSSAEAWLAEQVNLDGVSETIGRTSPDGEREEITIYHFTSAFVVRALAGAARPDRRAIERALRVVWSRYDPSSHLWTWSNGDVPVWLLADAVAAVQEAALALAVAPIAEAGSSAEAHDTS